VLLPSVSDAPDGFVSWTVTADGQPHVVHSQAHWVGVAEAAPPTSFALLRPVRTVVVSAEGSDEQVELHVIEPDDPMLVFGEDGRRLPANVPLPPDIVWIVHPEENDLSADGPLMVTVEGQLPLGWNGWRLRQLNLNGTRSLELDGLAGTRRPVRGYTRPRISTAAPLRGVTTPYGTPVYADVPEIWLPGDRSARTEWVVEIRRGDGGARVVNAYSLTEPQTATELWDRLPRPLLGSFDITVRGSLGRGATRTIFLAESLDVRFAPEVRVFGANGLSAARAELTPAVGARVNPRVLALGPTEQASVVEYRAGSETEPLVVTPPRVEVMHEHADQPVSWSSGPLRIVTETFTDEPGVLLVRVPGMTAVPRLQVVAGKKVVQEVPSSGRTQDGTARFELIRIADTVAAHRHLDLVFDVAGRSLLARVRPRRLASGVDWKANGLRLRDFVPVEGLTAGLYLPTAPWRCAETQPVGADGTVAVPPELRNAGPLLVALRVDDLWAPDTWPRWPTQAYSVAGVGHLSSPNPVETALSRFAAGLGEFPDDVSDLRMVWELLNLAPRLHRAPEATRIADKCAESLRLDPARAIVALADLGVTPAEVVTALVSSGLASTALGGDAEVASRLWPTAPVLGALFGNMGDESVWDAALAQCGNTVDVMSRTASDPNAAVGRFGREATAMVAMQPQQLESTWRAAQVVPRALLDPDTRMVAARRLFDRRADEGVWRVGRMASGIVRNALSVLASRPRLCAQVEARRSDGGVGEWQALPAASAALAIVGRRAARGDVRCQHMEQMYRPRWRQLAMSAPELVTIDLVLAELLVGLENTEI
jgi:hypothetical protein